MSHIASSAPEAATGMSEFPVRFDEHTVVPDPRTSAAVKAALVPLGFHEDDNSVFFAKSLEYTQAAAYQRPIPPMAADRLVPTDSETPEWADSITYEIYDMVGMAKIISSYADDLPRSDVRGVEKVVPVKTIGTSYGYTTKDLRTALANRSNLPVLRAESARIHVARKENSLKVKGDLTYNMFGIVNHPNISLLSATAVWSLVGTTGDTIVDDVNRLLNSIITQSNGAHTATVLGMASITRSILATKRMTGAAQTPVIEFLRQQYPELEMVVVEELRGQGAGGTHMLFAAERSATNYHYKAVMPFRQQPPQARNLEFVIPCEARSAGLVVMQPLALAVMGGL